jgi:hypothetical protein
MKMNSMKNLFGAGPKKVGKDSNPTLAPSKSNEVSSNKADQNGEEKIVYSKTEQDAVKKIFEVILKDAPE